jgi:hypothetical protein
MIPVVLSLLLLAAHFLRSGSLLLVGALVLMVALVPVRRAWAARALQVTLVLGTLEWLRTLFVLVSSRMQAGEPVTRLAAILGGVAAVTALSAWVFRGKRMRVWYRLGRGME